MIQSPSREIEDRFVAATLEYLADLARRHLAAEFEAEVAAVVNRSRYPLRGRG